MNTVNLLKEWLFEAGHDANQAVNLLQEFPEMTNIICYHCHQAAVKYLIALSITKKLPWHDSPNLMNLLDVCFGAGCITQSLREEAESLEEFSLSNKRMSSQNIISDAKTKRAVTILTNVKESVLKTIDDPEYRSSDVRNGRTF